MAKLTEKEIIEMGTPKAEEGIDPDTVMIRACQKAVSEALQKYNCSITIREVMEISKNKSHEIKGLTEQDTITTPKAD